MVEVFIGMISGIITSLGLGGGTILILLLEFFKDVSQHIMQGTNLVFFILSAMVSTFIYLRNKHIDFEASKWMILSGIFGGILGSLLSFKFESENLKKCFGIFLLVIAVLEIYSLIKEYIKAKRSE